MSSKKFLLTTVLPIVLSIIAGILIIVVNNNFILKSKARTMVMSEKKEFNDNIAALKDEEKELTQTSAAYDEILSQNAFLIEEVETLKTTYDNYIADIESANNTVAELDAMITDKQAFFNSLSELKPEQEGENITLSKGDYKCPADIKPGRYTAEGNTKIYFYTIANTLRDKVDLSVIDTHSYVFNIASGESIKTDGKLILKKINTEN